MAGAPNNSAAKFAIVCDSGCDLSAESLAAAGITVIPMVVRNAGRELRDLMDMSATDFLKSLPMMRGQLDSYAPCERVFSRTYEVLASTGVREIVSIHASAALSDAYDIALRAAISVTDATVHVADSKCCSAQLALVLARLVADRDAGMPAGEALSRAMRAARASRLMVVPAPDARPRSRVRAVLRGSFRARADFLRVRAVGARRVFRMGRDGVAVEAFRSTQLARLAGSIAREMSAYAQEMGPLTHLELTVGAPRVIAALEKPLDTNEFESVGAGMLEAAPSTAVQIGVGAAGIAYAPASSVSPDEVRSLVDGGRRVSRQHEQEVTKSGVPPADAPDAREPTHGDA